MNTTGQKRKPPLLLIILLQCTLAFSQKETYDIVDYTPPAGWTKQEMEGVRIFIKEDRQNGNYCLLSLFKSKPTNGIEADFDNAWHNIPVAVYKAPEKPLSKERADAEDGWKVISGSAQLRVQETDAICLLTVLSNNKRTICVFAVLNRENYLADIEKFLDGLNINQASLEEISNIKEQVATAGSAQQQGIRTGMSFDNFVYRLPENWVTKEEPKFLELFPKQAKELEVFSIILLKGKKSSASLQQELAVCWDELASMLNAQKLREVNGGNYNEDEVSRTFAGWEYIAGHGSIRTASDFFVHAYVFRVNDRVERVMVLAKEIRLDAMRSNIDPTVHHTPYYNTITDFIFNLRFSSSNSPELPVPILKGNGILGTWAGLGFMGGQLKTTYAIFFSNGQVFYGSRFPLLGLYQLNTYAEKERDKRYWGTYTFQNRNGTVSMPFGSFPIKLEDDKLVMSPISEEHRFIRLPSVDDVKLDGTWKIEDQDNNWVTISFTTDGSFTDNGALRVLDHSVYNYYSIADGGGSGKYFIKDHTIVFNYSDGRTLKIAFPGKQFTPGNNSPKELVLSFNDDLLIKK